MKKGNGLAVFLLLYLVLSVKTTQSVKETAFYGRLKGAVSSSADLTDLDDRCTAGTG